MCMEKGGGGRVRVHPLYPPPPPPWIRAWYGKHNPVGLKYLTRLCVGLSHLRAHKHQDNFSDTSSKCCSCRDNLPETVEHYLIHCPIYSLLRRDLFGNHRMIVRLLTLTSSAYTCNLRLYGNDFHTNKQILEHTISFIIWSKRFDGPLISNDYCSDLLYYFIIDLFIYFFFLMGRGKRGFLWASLYHCSLRGLKWGWRGCLCVYMYVSYVILVISMYYYYYYYWLLTYTRWYK